MWGITSFHVTGSEVEAVTAVEADAEGVGVHELGESDKAEEAPPGADPIELGVVHNGRTAQELVEVVLVYYDQATDTWWTEESGTVSIDVLTIQ